MAGITLINLVGYVPGVPAEEVGINVQKVSVKGTSEKLKVKDRVGRVNGLMIHDVEEEYSIEGFLILTAGALTGALSQAIGSIITVANQIALGGLPTGGSCLMEDPQIDYETGTLAKASWKAIYYSDIPAGSVVTVI